MENEKMIAVLNRIKNCIERGSLDIVKEYVKLEIDNLSGATEERCQNTRYYFYNNFCKYCDNENCQSNINQYMG